MFRLLLLTNSPSNGRCPSLLQTIRNRPVSTGARAPTSPLTNTATPATSKSSREPERRRFSRGSWTEPRSANGKPAAAISACCSRRSIVDSRSALRMRIICECFGVDKSVAWRPGLGYVHCLSLFETLVGCRYMQILITTMMIHIPLQTDSASSYSAVVRLPQGRYHVHVWLT